MRIRKSLRVVKEVNKKLIYIIPLWRVRQLPHVRTHARARAYTHTHTHTLYTRGLEFGIEIILCHPRYPRNDRVAPTIGKNTTW